MNTPQVIAYTSFGLLALVVLVIPIALFVPMNAQAAKGLAWLSLISLVLASLGAGWLSF